MRRCDRCMKPATWMYMPGSEVYCDEHVPRGCECMTTLKQGVVETVDADGCINNPASDYEPVRDDKGRLVPCVEYSYDAKGFADAEDSVGLLTRMFETAQKEGRT